MKVQHKFHAVMTINDGIHFGSKKEAKYYSDLKLRKKCGEILFFLRQTPLHLPGNIKYLVDFVEFHSDGTVHFVEVKGYDVPIGKLKRKQAEALYSIEIEVV